MRGGEADDDTEAGDQQEDDGDPQGSTGVVPLVIHVENFPFTFLVKIWDLS